MSSPVDPTAVTLAILAGGESRRMGVAKSSLQTGGRPILQYLLESLCWPGPTLLVTAPSREHPPAWQLFDREAVDPQEGQGPLRGVFTALQNSPTDLVIIATVDMPCVRREHLQWMLQQLADDSALSGLMLRRFVNGTGCIEPFPFACRKSAAGIIAARLQASCRSVHSLAEIAGFAARESPSDWPAQIWTNLNSPKDYEEFLNAMPRE